MDLVEIPKEGESFIENDWMQSEFLKDPILVPTLSSPGQIHFSIINTSKGRNVSTRVISEPPQATPS